MGGPTLSKPGILTHLRESKHAFPGTDVYWSLPLWVGQVKVRPGVEEQQRHVGVVPDDDDDDDDDGNGDGDGDDNENDDDESELEEEERHIGVVTDVKMLYCLI